MNESSPIKRDTARKYPDAPASTPVRRRSRFMRWMLVLVLLAFAGAYAQRHYEAKREAANDSASAKVTGGARGKHGEPAQAVGIAKVQIGEMPVVLQGLGTVTPLATVTMRSQISGYLTEIGFREGQNVKKGDFLAQIDSRPYEALLAQYQGQLARDQALLQNARLDLQRYQTLNRQDSISKQNVDTQAALVKQNEGTVAADQALVDQQKLNIAYTRIISPVDGRVGLRQVDQGNYISAASTNIVVVTQLRPISVVFTLPEDDVSQVMKQVRTGARLSVKAYDRGDQQEIATGNLDTVDNQIDVTTGTVKLRALFSNDDESLFPNQFVNAKLTVNTIKNAAILPTAAILRGTPGTYVYLMQGDDKVTVRPIQIGESDGPRTVVVSGLQAGDRVIIDGTDRLRDGANVRIIQSGAGSAGAAASEQTDPGSSPSTNGDSAPKGNAASAKSRSDETRQRHGRRSAE